MTDISTLQAKTLAEISDANTVEALESVQKGMSTHREVPWSVMSRGMAKEGEQLNTDELHLRAFWLQWVALMGNAA